MRCYEDEGSWNLSFSGAGFLGLYHVGVTRCFRERVPRLLQGARRIYGSSSGALNAVSIIADQSLDFCCSNLLGMVKHLEQLSLGIFHPAFAPIEHIRQQLQESLPPNIHILASQRLGISMTRWSDGRNIIVTNFATRNEVIQALICTVYFPFYCGIIPPEFRGERYIDGALSNHLPFSDSPSTITVSPFHGTVDICPQSTSANIHELNAFNASLQISTKNFFLGFSCLISPNSEVAADNCRQGYLDALRFLERRGLTKEPVLWMLVSKEPPAPADGSQDTGHNRGQEGGLSLNWAVPNVLVKDVPNFEQLSPELEAALQKACTRDASTWARFCRSRPGRALTYLLLPCTLPFEYIYFRSKRLVAWLPDMPADVWWMQGVLQSLAAEIYTRSKDQLLRLVSLPVTSPLQPGAAPLVDLAKDPRPPHQA
ncbi:patatin-like phospholipase domain-containing protein 5 isoform X1 [Canis lupus familiaris]|uniref:Patatin-like phospholipase domain-containing protein 5 n=1 Tax=Canis lupus familiaris TaxID=9615 RepID=A0A8P0N427_CANLF|nr:patatin-like phospholipase domain-containing protein 5 isoform X1 [Canis lupus dingo]XP_538337.3 patatin-like phospholipase domain-containing protein 5 isoform X1 [Canis lupus familiaris]